MEQNLSEKERKQRLALGLINGILAVVSIIFYENRILSAILFFASLGFIANYFTCFCGTKRLISKVKEYT